MRKTPGTLLRRISGPATVLLLLVNSAFAENAPNERQTGSCSNATLHGNFGFTARGVTLAASPVPPPLQGPFASAGRASFDGKGGFILTAVSSFNGSVQSTAAKGTYSVNKDCTYTSAAENGVTFRAVIVNGGSEIFILQTTPGVAISGQAQAQAQAPPSLQDLISSARPLRCSNLLTQAPYGFIAEGAVGPPTLPAGMAGPLTGVGTVAFDPNGTFLLAATRSVNGVLDPEPLALKGTYAVNPDCTFRMNFEVGFTFSAVIVNGGREILFLESDPGTTLLVKAARI